MGVSGTAKALSWRTASRLEQEIRAYPRVYRTFYRALSASPTVRAAVGRIKTGVREGSTRAAPEPWQPPLTDGDRRRRTATAARLGLQKPGSS